jgi:hypothetical protein
LAEVRLTDSQQRHLGVFLAQVEDTVLAIERLATAPPSRSALRLDRPDFPPGFADSIGPEIARFRDELARLIQLVGLEPLETSRRREAQGLLAIAIVQLQDAGSRGLRGYGDIDPSLTAILDPALESLRASLTRIAGHLEPMASSPPS